MTKVAILEVVFVKRGIPRDSDQNQYHALPVINHDLARLHALVHNLNRNRNRNHGHSHSHVQPRIHLRVVPCSPLPTHCKTFLQMAGSQKLILLLSFAYRLRTNSSAHVVRRLPFLQVLAHLCVPYHKILYLWYQSLDLLARHYTRSLRRILVINEQYVGELRVQKA